MTTDRKDKPKVDKPADHFDKPEDVAKDSSLSATQKKDALDTWEQDARQLLTASNEGMAAPDEGVKPKATPSLDDVVKAKDEIGETPNPKSSH